MRHFTGLHFTGLPLTVAAAGFVLVSLGLSSAKAQSGSDDAAADRTAFERVCGNCHSTTMIGDLKTEPEWIETVENMESIGAKGTEEEFDRVRRYLARNFTRINVNAATAAQIAPVLDITETAAQAVVEYRTKHGDFMNLEDLRKVPELDAAKIEARKQRVVFR